MKFSSSGREDVDVRCLGTGRPFVVEFINPCRTKFTRSEMKELQAAINSNTKLVALRDLQVVDRYIYVIILSLSFSLSLCLTCLRYI